MFRSLYYISSEGYTMFSRLCSHVQQASSTCSAGFAHMFSRLCSHVQQALLTCSAGFDHMFSRLYSHVQLALLTFPSGFAHMFSRLCSHVQQAMPCCRVTDFTINRILSILKTWVKLLTLYNLYSYIIRIKHFINIHNLFMALGYFPIMVVYCYIYPLCIL
jgi:hypothetical protein